VLVKFTRHMVILGVAAALAGCGASTVRDAGNDTTPSPAPPSTAAPDTGSSVSGGCLLGANGVDVEVGIDNASASCSTWISNLAGTGLVWYPISQIIAPGSAGTADGDTMEQACDLTDGGQELYVEDGGGQSYGDTICSQEEQNGWTPESSPGPLAAQAQQEAQQQAQAAASASAAQASAAAAANLAQEISQDQQNLQSDLGSLESDSNSLNTSTQLASDVNQMKTDYQTEQNDYQTEQQQGSCSDGSMGDDAATVSDDAATVDDDLSSLQDDLQSLQDTGTTSGGASIGGLEVDVATVNSDVSSLNALGATPAQDPSSALATAKTDLGNANAAVTWATQQGNTIDGEADQLATTAENFESQQGC
jgi:hypothetical protein